jgi:hypothetical protein
VGLSSFRRGEDCKALPKLTRSGGGSELPLASISARCHGRCARHDGDVNQRFLPSAVMAQLYVDELSTASISTSVSKKA